MKNLKNYLLGAGLFLALSVPAFAQDTTEAAKPTQTAPAGAKAQKGQGKRGGRTVSLAIMPVSAIDAVVKLKDDQKTKIEGILDKLKEDDKAAAGDRPKMQELSKKANEDILAILTDEQKEALKKETPMLGLLSRTKAIPLGVFADLKLTDDQKSKIEDAAKDAQAKMRDAKGDRAAQQTIQSDFKAKVEGFLTDDQKKMIAEHPDKMTKKKKKTE